MAVELVYEDLSVLSTETTDYRDFPVDGLQGIKANGRVYTGLDCCGLSKTKFYLPRPTVSYREMKAKHSRAHMIRSRNTSTRQFHRIEVMLGIWSEKNPVPFEGWEKDVKGWRLWTETEVFDSTGIAEAEWFDYWDSLPSTGIQGLMLYENWKTRNGIDYRQIFGGKDHYALAPSPFGPVFINSNDTPEEIKQRYGVGIKTGTQLPDGTYKALLDEMVASVTL